MFQNESHTGIGQVRGGNDFPFLDKEFGKESRQEDCARETTDRGVLQEESAVKANQSIHPFNRDGMIPLWPSLDEMIKTMDKDYEWKHELENMLIVRAVVTGTVLMAFMAMALVVFSI